jgi:CheY-like chemotaxis protein
VDGAIDWVVFVDDEELVLQSLSALMSLAGEPCEAEFAQSGDEALSIIDEIHARGERVSVVIADYIMPAMKGDALLVEVHRRWPLVRTIMLKGQSDMTGVARAINEGNLFRFIEKPFDNRDILLTIRAAREACLQEIELADKNARLATLNAQLQAANQNLEREVAARTRDLERRNVELADALRSLEDSERIARHDLKSPLGSIEASVALIGEVDVEGLAPEARQLLEVIRRAAVRAKSMVNLSLALRRMEDGTFRLMPSPVVVGDVLQQAIVDLAAHARSKGIECRLDATGSALVAGDALLCYSLFANVLKNAIEAAPDASVVTLSERREGADVVVAIHNRGEIPAPVADRFFDKYSTYGKTNGNGLGNYSAFLIARAHGGRIEATTSATAGTTVTVVLPALGTSAPDEHGDAGPHAAGAHPTQASARTHVLVVDDEPHNRMVLGAMIRKHDVRVSEADNGKSALELLASDTPDIVFLDIEMPVLGGLETLAAILERKREAGNRSPAVVAFSAHDDPESVAGYLRAGFDGYLPKPPTARHLARYLGAPSAGIRDASAAALTDEVRVDRELEAVFGNFKATRIDLFDDLERALQNADAAAAGTIAHKLAGSLAMYGYAALATACSSLEQRIRGQGELPGCEEVSALKSRLRDARVVFD